MDLQAAQADKGREGRLSKLAALFCLALTGLLLVGSLIQPGRAHPRLPDTAQPILTQKLPPT